MITMISGHASYAQSKKPKKPTVLQGSQPQGPVTNDLLPSQVDPPSNPGDPGDPDACTTCTDEQNPAFLPFELWQRWTGGDKKGLFVCDTRHKMGLGTATPASRIEIKGQPDDQEYTRGLRLTYGNLLQCHSLMFEYNGDGSYIGSLSPLHFHIRTNNQERISIAKTGEVGINTSDFRGNFNVNGSTVLGDPTNPNANSIYGNHVLVTDNLAINTNSYSNQLNIGGNASIGTNAAAPENGLLVAGNVGIGTNNPVEKLEVNGTLKATNLKLSGLTSGLVSLDNGSLVNATQGQVATLLGITGTTDYLPKFGAGSELENSYIRQASVDGRKCIGMGINGNATYDLKENFHFSNFQTLHVDGGGSHFGFNTYSKLENENWTYPKLYTALNNVDLGASDIIQHADGRISFNNLQATENENQWQTVMSLTPDRKVGIGTTSPTSKLQINGDLRLTNTNGETEFLVQTNGEVKCRKVKVTLDNLNDVVFLPGYRLPSLKEVESYIKANGHLPEVPSQAEVAKDGMDVGEMNNILLKKIEEMTLHLIRLEKEVEALKNTK